MGINLKLILALSPRHLSRYPAKKLTDINYAVDLTVTADTITNDTALLQHLENAANNVGTMAMLLKLNS